MKSFSEVEQFRHVVKRVRLYHEHIGKSENLPVLTYDGTIKLHGTNSGVRRFKDKIQPQSRQRIINIGCDNHGFASFIFNVPRNEIDSLFDRIGTKEDDITLYGEWVGSGVQDTVAVSHLPNKQWVLFAAYVNDKWVKLPPDVHAENHSIYNIAKAGMFTVVVDFNEPEKALTEFTKLTEIIEDKCPWGALFGIDGIGEGIVWTCRERPDDSEMWFKTKGEKHSGKSNKTRKTVTVDPEKVQSIEECADLVLPQWRLKQGLTHLKDEGYTLEMKNLGHYLKWINKDVIKEEEDVITANGLEWKDIAKAVASRARSFYMNEVNSF